jgi:hypothetical protein
MVMRCNKMNQLFLLRHVVIYFVCKFSCSVVLPDATGV